MQDKHLILELYLQLPLLTFCENDNIGLRDYWTSDRINFLLFMSPAYDHVDALMHMKHCASTSMCDLLLHIKMTLKLSTSIDK